MSRALLADENFPGNVINALLAAGYDVLSVATYSPGISDRAVLELACSSGRRLLTFDSDFGDLIFAQGAAAPAAIFYFRLHPIVVEEVTQIALRALVDVPDGFFAVVSRESIRLRTFTFMPR
jgi:predicted nuclease of predicted toxin-antitoxin system